MLKEFIERRKSIQTTSIETPKSSAYRSPSTPATPQTPRMDHSSQAVASTPVEFLSMLSTRFDLPSEQLIHTSKIAGLLQGVPKLVETFDNIQQLQHEHIGSIVNSVFFDNEDRAMLGKHAANLLPTAYTSNDSQMGNPLVLLYQQQTLLVTFLNEMNVTRQHAVERIAKGSKLPLEFKERNGAIEALYNLQEAKRVFIYRVLFSNTITCSELFEEAAAVLFADQ
jgi:hypothetical protein